MKITVEEEKKGWLQSLREGVHNAISRWFSRKDGGDGSIVAGRQSSSLACPGYHGLGSFSGFPFLAGPAVDVIDQGDRLKVLAELPGLDTKDFTVSVEGSRLFLKGERKSSHEERKDGFVYRECSFGAFSRVVPLPDEVDASGCKAKYSNGVLEIDLPKTGKSRRKSIKVTVD